MRNRKAGGEMVYEIHPYSVKKAFALIPVKDLKVQAQVLREHIDWYGRTESNTEQGIMYDCIMEIIHISDPTFRTQYQPVY